MKRKELKKLAQRLAELEMIIEHSDDHEARLKAQNEVLDISSRVVDIEDMLALDELTQKILEKS